MIAIFVAQARNRVIGNAGRMPWHLPADLKRFKAITSGHTVIMGRKTFESILGYLGKPLPNRRNIIVTRDKQFTANDAEVVYSLQEALALAQNDEAFIIGGAQIYEQALPFVDRIYLTQVDTEVDGDTFFPELHQSEWRITQEESHAKDERNPCDYTFVTYDRAA